MDPDRKIAAAILTGGRATRLGGARKGSLAIGGRSIADRQLEVLRDIADPIFAVAAADGPIDEHLETVRDALPGGGALVGIYTAITHSPHDRTLVVACDMPFLDRRFLAAMIAIDADLVIPRSARGYEPLCAIYSKRCSANIRSRLDRGERQAAALPEGVKVVEIGPETLAAYDPDDLMFVNVNTPHDYERANKLLERRLKALRDRIMDELGP
ncbi:MAG TPA: molybdenum cofactor guanylyltransferase [Vicinamibacterales bacterium]|nr:molybdenum cofactor guanylyltransferase [Vicinamibacterales bacterium]